jgi:hypothetical protein
MFIISFNNSYIVQTSSFFIHISTVSLTPRRCSYKLQELFFQELELRDNYCKLQIFKASTRCQKS